jgi:MFS family permease
LSSFESPLPSSASAAAPRSAREAVYTHAFWLAYAANVLLVTANALTFRFAEFVKWLGGTEAITGQIVSVGMIGSLLARLSLGRDIDGHGIRRMWIGSSLLFVIGAAATTVTETLGWELYAARAAFAVGLSSMFACSISHIQHPVPPHRRTEVIGMLGSSGFVGMIFGTQLGDLLFQQFPPGRFVFTLLFSGTTLCGVLYLALVVYLTRGDRHVRPQETYAAHRLMFRYWPGPVVLVALMMGLGFVVTTVFLTRHATEAGLPGIRTFFTVYALSAFVVRWVSRNWSYSIGRHRMILLGLLGHGLGFLMLSRVSAEWHLIGPAMLCGFGHALLFPCVVSLGSGAFPPEYRGSGTTLTLGFMDLGILLSAPLLGRVIDEAGFDAMYLASSGVTLTIAAIYGLSTAGVVDGEQLGRAQDRPVEVAAPVESAVPELRESPPPLAAVAEEAN